MDLAWIWDRDSIWRAAYITSQETTGIAWAAGMNTSPAYTTTGSYNWSEPRSKATQRTEQELFVRVEGSFTTRVGTSTHSRRCVLRSFLQPSLWKVEWNVNFNTHRYVFRNAVIKVWYIYFYQYEMKWPKFSVRIYCIYDNFDQFA